MTGHQFDTFTVINLAKLNRINFIPGIIQIFDVSKAYVDNLAQRGLNLTVAQAQTLKVDVPLYQGVPILAELATEISDLLEENDASNAKKVSWDC